MAYNMGGRRFRPVGSGKKRTAPQYGPVGTGCPFVEEAVARLYREQNEEHFWSLMNALNYALELQTKVLVPLDAAVDPRAGPPPGHTCPSRRIGPRACRPGCSTPGKSGTICRCSPR